MRYKKLERIVKFGRHAVSVYYVFLSDSRDTQLMNASVMCLKGAVSRDFSAFFYFMNRLVSAIGLTLGLV